MKGHVENKFEFCIGDTVNASRRKVPPLNEEGGLARVINIHFAGGRVTYDIQYVLDGRKEYRLDVAVLTRHDVNDTDQRRPQRNKIAARSGKRYYFTIDIFFRVTIYLRLFQLK